MLIVMPTSTLAATSDGLVKFRNDIENAIGKLGTARAGHEEATRSLDLLRDHLLKGDASNLSPFFEKAGQLLDACKTAFSQSGEVSDALESCLRSLASLVADAATEFADLRGQLRGVQDSYKELHYKHEQLLKELNEKDDKQEQLVNDLKEKLDRQDQSIMLGKVPKTVDHLASRFTYGYAYRRYEPFPSIADRYDSGELTKKQRAGYDLFCTYLDSKGFKPVDLIKRTKRLRDLRNPIAHGTRAEQRRVKSEQLLQWATARDEAELGQVELDQEELGALEDEEREDMRMLQDDVQELLPLLEGLAEEEGHPLVLCNMKVKAIMEKLSRAGHAGAGVQR